ncbi:MULTISPECIES: thioesterase domain-containing protein [Streptomyces]|uniref:thioesterase domain-containing protein n=1 Tax=Streptomyces TaxID=1883 RepID=UPI0003166A41|nr:MULTISPECIES: thioesterase domain-containing protein [Streptomyces]QKV68302.1 thioesterase [Streptomyces harbinensis]
MTAASPAPAGTPAPPAAPAADAGLLIPISRSAGPLRTVVLHPAGGGLGPYLGLAAALARYGPVSGIRAPGLLPGEEPDDSVPGMTARYLRLIDRLESPVGLLLGWSLGGLLAWELAGRLAARGERPRVVMLDSPALPPAHDGRDGRDRAALRERVIDSAGTAGHDTELVARTTDAHLRALTRHTVRGGHDHRALLVSCAAEPDAAAHLAHWRTVAPGLRTVSVPCGHFDLLTPPRLRTTTGLVTDFLRDTGPAGPAPASPIRPAEEHP